MSITVKLDQLLVQRKKRSKELAEHVGITEQYMSLIKNGKIKGMRFSTLEKMCRFLECEPGDLLELGPEEDS